MTTLVSARPDLATLPTRWALDITHSSATFAIRHLMIATVRGKIAIRSGTVHGTTPANVRVTADLDLGSIDTGAKQRDDHLRSADFFDVANHPTMRFASVGIEQTGEQEFRLRGDLTIRGVTKPVVLEGEVTGLTRDPWGKQRVGVAARATLDRTHWGLTWNQALETGGVLVGDKVKVELDLQLVESA